MTERGRKARDRREDFQEEVGLVLNCRSEKKEGKILMTVQA